MRAGLSWPCKHFVKKLVDLVSGEHALSCILEPDGSDRFRPCAGWLEVM
jgi:hypothetical protein